MPVDRDRYRQLAGSFPTGVTIVTTVDANGAPRGLTTQSFIGLSQDPPLVLVAIDKTARTLASLKRARGFVVNFVRYGADDVATRFASKSDDKFAGLAWRASEAGDHWIFIAEVEGGEHLGGAPLMYYHRTYAAWPEEKPAPQVG
jgi:flavin reductase (DIM6/NTAB) family NADH-FMN oxidoreductase RutF